MCEDKIRDPAIRPAKESDIPDIIELFKLNYKVYPHPELYQDERWLRSAIPGDDALLLVLEEENKVLAFGALFLDYGDYHNRLGLIGGIVAANAGLWHGLTLGERIIKALEYEAREKVEYVVSEARTAHSLSQRYLRNAHLIVAGFLPHYNIIDEAHENLVLYTNLYDAGRMSRSKKLPQVIPQVASLAQHVLSSMNLPTALDIVGDCLPYPGEINYDLLPEETHSLAQLRQIDCERPGDPVLFDSVSLDYGLPVTESERISYRMAVDNQQPAGGIGYRIDPVSQIFKLTDLVFNKAEVINYLCARAVSIAKEKGVRIIEADLSAYDARIQQTFLSYGFHPVAYLPAMAFHKTYRLDTVKMIRLEIPYAPGRMRLVEEAREVASMVLKSGNEGSGLAFAYFPPPGAR